MKTQWYFVCFLSLLSLITLFGCQKDPETFLPETTFASTQNQSAEDRGNEGSCENIPPKTNFVSVIFNRTGGVGNPMCFTEQSIKDAFALDDGRAKVDTLLKRLFYQDEAAKPETAPELLSLLVRKKMIPASEVSASFNMDVYGRMDYPAKMDTTSAGPRPGFIDFYTVRQAKTNGALPLLLYGGFSGLRFRNRCTGQTITFEFPNTVQGFADLLTQTGFSKKTADLTIKNLMRGRYNIRQVWNLFQLQVAPQLPLTKKLLAESGSENCWHLYQAGIGLYDAGAFITSFYFAQGEGGL